ncbi:MAG: hypothetical protein FJW26_18200 [Acidimicrobiia bacterium]|nr:hypothetical protein [Acidimicrobiia bacterium]
MPSIDSQEIDAALDSVRTDLHQEAQRRDEFLARQLELEIQQGGQSILEFEPSLSAGQGTEEAVASAGKGGEFELDEVLRQTVPESPVSAATSASDSAGKWPTLTIQQPSARNWLPYFVLLFLALLAAACFWFWR